MTESFKGWLICIFSYNRATMLENLLVSIQAFYPDMALAIFDDGSDEPAAVELLETLKKSGVYVYTHLAGSVSSKHGGLYELRDIALAYATSQSYKYAY